MPGSFHRFCAWHLWQNFHKKFSGAEFKKLFWKAANTANFNEFLNVMAEIKRLNVQAHEYLMAIDVKHWSRCKFEHTPKVDLNTNNHTESFNGWLDGLRHLPPIQLLEKLREQHTGLMYTRHVISQRYTGKMPPKVKMAIRDATRNARSSVVRRCGEYEFQVELEDYKGTVRLDEKHCDCEMWQVSGIPCMHAVACINTIRGNVEDYCHHFFSVDNWRKCYMGVIHPIPSMNFWPQFENMDLQPPVACSLPGRPKKHWRRSQGDQDWQHSQAQKGVVFATSLTTTARHVHKHQPWACHQDHLGDLSKDQRLLEKLEPHLLLFGAEEEPLVVDEPIVEEEAEALVGMHPHRLMQ